MLKMKRGAVTAAGQRGVNPGLTTAMRRRSGRVTGRVKPTVRRIPDACAETTPKCVTSVDNVMTQA